VTADFVVRVAGALAIIVGFAVRIAGAGVVTAEFAVGVVGTVAVVIFRIIPFLPKSVRSLLIHEFSLFLLFFACTTRILRKIIKILTFVWALLY
jgi:hypothetical protein